MTNPRIVSTLLLVFLAGVAAGMVGMSYGVHGWLHRAVSAQHEPGRDAVLQNFKTKLNLSSDQVEKIALVLEDYRHYYDSLQDQIDDVRSTGRSRIVQILDPDQRDKFEKMMAELAPQLDSGRKSSQ